MSAAYGELYERLIQFGAHPNEKSITSNLRIEKGAGTMMLNQVYLQGDGKALDHWLRTASQLVICTLKIFERSHHARFAELKVSPRIAELALGLYTREDLPSRTVVQFDEVALGMGSDLHRISLRAAEDAGFPERRSPLPASRNRPPS